METGDGDLFPAGKGEGRSIMRARGAVAIVGAGPGDPGLLTLRGRECLRRAEVVVYDHLVSQEILGLVSPSARLFYAGKEGGRHALPQDEINSLLVREARGGAFVVRLKGGDPFIFGRGGEEAEALEAAGIPFEIVPGVSAAVAAPAYAGIPLTHRRLSASVAFATGHEDPLKERSAISWQALAGVGTLVVLMAIKNLKAVTKGLIDHGRSDRTPAALIRWGTTADQETLTATLGDIAAKAAEAGFRPPAVLVVGEVVTLRDRLSWFETRPLFGRGIVVTRPEGQAEGFNDLLRAAGARVIPFPTIKVVPPASWEGLDRAIGDLEAYDWIVFTSANGAAYFFQRLAEVGRDVRDLKGIKIAAIGPATAASVAKLGIRTDLLPERFVAESVVEAFAGHDMKGKRVLLARAAEARDVIPQGLSGLGAEVDIAVAYRTVRSDRRPEELIPLFAASRVDAVTFTSPSTVKHFLGIMGPDFRLPEGVRVACIGPVTAEAARKAGLAVDILCDRYTAEGLLEALTNYDWGR